jgi:hypothetical protein
LDKKLQFQARLVDKLFRLIVLHHDKFTHLFAYKTILAFPFLASSQFTLLESGGIFRADAVNLATGATVEGSSELGAPHFIANLNYGQYGNTNGSMHLD